MTFYIEQLKGQITVRTDVLQNNFCQFLQRYNVYIFNVCCIFIIYSNQFCWPVLWVPARIRSLIDSVEMFQNDFLNLFRVQ